MGLALAGESRHQGEDILLPYPVLIVVLVVAGENVVARLIKADHAVQDELSGPGASIESDVVLFQVRRLRREGHGIISAVEHREHAGAGRCEGQLLTAREGLLQDGDEFVGRDALTQSGQPPAIFGENGRYLRRRSPRQRRIPRACVRAGSPSQRLC